MDDVYHGLESALLALGFALGVTAFAVFAAASPQPPYAVTLPMLSVSVPVIDGPPASR